MSAGPIDPRWPKLLSLTAHELRSPLTVVGGYIRMLLKDSAGPLTDQQRRLLNEAEKSCGRLSGLVAEVSELAHLESGTSAFNRGTIDLQTVFTDAIAALPVLTDRTVAIDVSGDHVPPMNGDATRLTNAFSAILNALRRELVTSDHLSVQLQTVQDSGSPFTRITIGEAERIDALVSTPQSSLTTFDEWRGGNGLALPNARRIIELHGGHVWGPAGDNKAAVVVSFPQS